MIDNDRENYFVDLHLHTTYSADGEQSLIDVIQRTSNKGFDIISLTDHDSIKGYCDLAELLRKDEIKNMPIIIPGVEFSVSYPNYGDLCHVLKYFINPFEEALVRDISVNEKAYWNRIYKQFIRISENKCLGYFSEVYNIKFTIEEYKDFLKDLPIGIPEYPTLIDYIYSKLSDKKITIMDVVNKVLEFNKLDTCTGRREKKYKVIERLKSRYTNDEINMNGRLLMSVLATVGIDDDKYNGYESSGNLSVDEYGQIDIFDLNKSGVTVFAHPTGTKLNCIDDALSVGGGVFALELNKRNRHATKEDILLKAKQNNLLVTIGSDSHSTSDGLYDDMEFYKISKNELKNFYKAIIKKLK